VMAAVPMVQEEEAADEFRPEPELQEVEDARLRGAVGPKFVWCGGAMPEITKVVLKAAIEMMGEEFGWPLQVQGVMRRTNQTMVTCNNLEAPCTLVSRVIFSGAG
jgi:hypothetical protein